MKSVMIRNPQDLHHPPSTVARLQDYTTSPSRIVSFDFVLKLVGVIVEVVLVHVNTLVERLALHLSHDYGQTH